MKEAFAEPGILRYIKSLSDFQTAVRRLADENFEIAKMPKGAKRTVLQKPLEVNKLFHVYYG